MTKQTDLAYLAGIFDGEGCISFVPAYTKTSKMRDHRQPRLQIGNTDAGLLIWIRDNFGGNLPAKPEKSYRRSKPYWRWTMYSSKAVALLREVLPYLKIKKRQAEILIEHQALREANRKWVPNGYSHRGYSEEVTKKLLSMQTEISRLNRVGPAEGQPQI